MFSAPLRFINALFCFCGNTDIKYLIAKLRERVCVEHSLSHIGHWQGEQARYVGSRKNLFDLRRVAVVHTLHVLAKIFTNTTEPASTSI